MTMRIIRTSGAGRVPTQQSTGPEHLESVEEIKPWEGVRFNQGGSLLQPLEKWKEPLEEEERNIKRSSRGGRSVSLLFFFFSLESQVGSGLQLQIRSPSFTGWNLMFQRWSNVIRQRSTNSAAMWYVEGGEYWLHGRGDRMSFTFLTLKQSYLEAWKLVLFSSLQGRKSSLRKRVLLCILLCLAMC